MHALFYLDIITFNRQYNDVSSSFLDSNIVFLLNIAFYYINCSGIASGSKSKKMVSHMCG